MESNKITVGIIKHGFFHLNNISEQNDLSFLYDWNESTKKIIHDKIWESIQHLVEFKQITNMKCLSSFNENKDFNNNNDHFDHLHEVTELLNVGSIESDNFRKSGLNNTIIDVSGKKILEITHIRNLDNNSKNSNELTKLLKQKKDEDSLDNINGNSVIRCYEYSCKNSVGNFVWSDNFLHLVNITSKDIIKVILKKYVNCCIEIDENNELKKHLFFNFEHLITKIFPSMIIRKDQETGNSDCLCNVETINIFGWNLIIISLNESKVINSQLTRLLQKRIYGKCLIFSLTQTSLKELVTKKFIDNNKRFIVNELINNKESCFFDIKIRDMRRLLLLSHWDSFQREEMYKSAIGKHKILIKMGEQLKFALMFPRMINSYLIINYQKCFSLKCETHQETEFKYCSNCKRYLACVKCGNKKHECID